MHATLVAALAAGAAAVPLAQRRQAPAGVDDGVILNYALSLEHLEATFYREGLAQYSADDFEAAGLGADFYNNLQEIAKDEASHVEFLSTALSAVGVTPAQECTYNFGYTDVQSFLATANLLEGVGVSAYLGAAQFIADKAYLTAAGSILTVEARHSAYLRDNQTPRLSPFPAPYDIPQSFNNVFSLAAPLITACPDGTDGTLGLPFTAYPAIAVSPAGIANVGDVLEFTVAGDADLSGVSAAYFITFPGGPIEAPIATTGGRVFSVTVPEAAQPGQAYIVLTSGGVPTDDNTVAGPAVVQIADNAVAFDKANPDYKPPKYGKDDKDCDEKHPGGYGDKDKDGHDYPKSPEDYPKKPEDYPEHKDDEHKGDYEHKDDEHKGDYEHKDDEHKGDYDYEHKDEHKDEYPVDKYPEHKDDEHKGEYPVDKYPEHKDDEHKGDYDYDHKDDHKDEPEHYPDVYDKKGNKYTLDKDGKPYVCDHEGKPYPINKDGYPYYKDEKSGKEYTVDYEGKPEYPDVYDKSGNKYPLDKDGKPEVYDSYGKPYPIDKDGKPYGKDETTGKEYTVDYQGNKEPCEEGYKASY